MTSRPRASEVMKFGSPANSSRLEEGVELAAGAGAADGVAGISKSVTGGSKDEIAIDVAPFDAFRGAGRRVARFIDKEPSIHGRLPYVWMRSACIADS